MALFVEDFMEGIMADAELACHHKQFKDPDQMEILKEKLCAYFKYKLDGSKHYIGRSMPDVHRNLGISNEVFDSACEVFLTSLKKFRLRKEVMQTFAKRISGIRHEICFPPVIQAIDQDESQTGNAAGNIDSLFGELGQDLGLRNIVDSMFE